MTTTLSDPRPKEAREGRLFRRGGRSALGYQPEVALTLTKTGDARCRQLWAVTGDSVADPGPVFCTMDHLVDTLPGRGDDTRMPGGRAFITETREAALEAGIRFFDVHDPDQGIVHVISPELGIVLPGATVVCPDSHTCTQGALGAFAWGIGSTEAEHALATGTLRVSRPKTMRVRFEGTPAPGVTAKDLSLALISRHGSAGGNGHVLEYAGRAVRDLDIEARLTLCNMATDFSAVSALIAPDREDKVHQIYSAMQTGQAQFGMQTFNQSLATLVFKKQISLQLALSMSSNPDELQDMINRGAGVVGQSAGSPATAAAARWPDVKR